MEVRQFDICTTGLIGVEMKKYVVLSLILPFLLLPLLVIQGEELIDGDDFSFVEQGFRSGSASVLSGNFGMTVDLKILDTEDAYGKSQAELLLDGFFKKNPPSSFTISHRNTRASSAFFVGDLIAGGSSYRVNVFLREGGGKWQITQIQILRGGSN